MTQRAIPSFPRCRRLDGAGVLGVCCRRPVTDLAGDILVVTLTLDRRDVVMTLRTHLVAGILDLLRYNFIHCCRTEVTVLAEIRRNQNVPDGDQQGHQDGLCP